LLTSSSPTLSLSVQISVSDPESDSIDSAMFRKGNKRSSSVVVVWLCQVCVLLLL
jgi:hypothetical protein